MIENVAYLENFMVKLKENYEELWLRSSKRNGLDYILEKFNAQITNYEQKIEQIENAGWRYQ